MNISRLKGLYVADGSGIKDDIVLWLGGDYGRENGIRLSAPLLGPRTAAT